MTNVLLILVLSLPVFHPFFLSKVYQVLYGFEISVLSVPGSQNSVFSHSCIRPRPVPTGFLMTLWMPAYLFMVDDTLNPLKKHTTSIRCHTVEHVCVPLHFVPIFWDFLSLSSSRAVSPCHMWVIRLPHSSFCPTIPSNIFYLFIKMFLAVYTPLSWSFDHGCLQQWFSNFFFFFKCDPIFK